MRWSIVKRSLYRKDAQFNILQKQHLNFLQQLTQLINNESVAKRLSKLFKRYLFKKGEIICSTNDEAREFYFLAEGEMDVMLATKDATYFRVSKLKAGTIVGELGHFLNKRNAEMRAATDVIIYKLSYETLSIFSNKHPSESLHFMEAIGKKNGFRVRCNKCSSFEGNWFF